MSKIIVKICDRCKQVVACKDNLLFGSWKIKKISSKSNEFCPYGDCAFYQAYDDGDDYPPDILCEKANEWFDYVLPCYECEGKWSAEQICAYIAREEARLRKKRKERSK
jgi:hypothetical protein